MSRRVIYHKSDVVFRLRCLGSEKTQVNFGLSESILMRKCKVSVVGRAPLVIFGLGDPKNY